MATIVTLIRSVATLPLGSTPDCQVVATMISLHVRGWATYRAPSSRICVPRTGPGHDSRPVAAGVIDMMSAGRRDGLSHTSVIGLVSPTVSSFVHQIFGGSP